VVTLGSAFSADDASIAWQSAELGALRDADAAGVPILGM
jgi:hypothetical protein